MIYRFLEHSSDDKYRRFRKSFSETEEYTKLYNKYSEMERLKNDYFYLLRDDLFEVEDFSYFTYDDFRIHVSISKKYKDLDKVKKIVELGKFKEILMDLESVDEFKDLIVDEGYSVVGDGDIYTMPFFNGVGKSNETQVNLTFIKKHDIKEIKDAFDRFDKEDNGLAAFIKEVRSKCLELNIQEDHINILTTIDDMDVEDIQEDELIVVGIIPGEDEMIAIGEYNILRNEGTMYRDSMIKSEYDDWLIR